MGCLFIIVVLAVLLFMLWRNYRIQDFYPVSQVRQDLTTEELEKMLTQVRQKIVTLEKHLNSRR